MNEFCLHIKTFKLRPNQDLHMTHFGPISAIELPKKNLEDAYVIESTSTALPGPGTFGKY